MFSTELPAESFFTVAHCADQTHAGDCKAEQGYTCMDIVDTDRWGIIQGHFVFVREEAFWGVGVSYFIKGPILS